uniref:Calmodulin n=1 Tax=Arundo donax TaxID=35708 RepID=A0A0A9ETM2_ARUDO
MNILVVCFLPMDVGNFIWICLWLYHIRVVLVYNDTFPFQIEMMN